MTLLVATLVALTCLYVCITVALTVGLGRPADHGSRACPRVSIVICARNEADRIGRCLDAVAAQTYDGARTQVVVVDDRSTDGTGEIARRRADRIPGLEVVPVVAQTLRCPKKNALRHGLDAATGEIILTTDADCEPAPGWVASTVSCFDERTGVVVGPAPLTDPGGRFGKLAVFQSLVVNALAAGSAGIGVPLTASGRNLAYRRTAFDRAGGYDPIGHIVGGDDVLLARRLHRAGWRVVYNQDAAATVSSPAHIDRQWSRQVRYQSKARHYDLPILSVALLIYIFHLLLLAAPVWVWLAPGTLPILGTVLLLRAAADGVFLWRAARRLARPGILRWFPIVEILMVPYVAVFCALGTVRPSTWT